MPTSANSLETVRRHLATRPWVTILLLLVVAVSIRVVDLGGRSLWVDEGATAVIADLPLDEIGDAAGSGQVHPPGYYTLIHLTSQISRSELGLRLPSVIASSLAVVLTYLVGRRLVDNRFGLVAAAILIVSPLDLWYAQEARQPVFAGLAVIVAAWGLLRSGIIGLSVSAIALIAGLYLDFITAVGWAAVGGIVLACFLKSDRRKVIEWTAVTLIGVLVFAPLEGDRLEEGFQVLLGNEGAGIWYGDVLGSNPITSNALGLLLLGIGFTVLALVIGERLTRSGRKGSFWATVIVLGFAIGSALTPIPRAYSVKKIMVVGWPLLALLVAYLILHRVAASARWKILVSVLILSLVASGVSFFVPKDDWRGVTAFVNTHADSGDAVWVGPDPWAADAYLYYDGNLTPHYDPEPDDELAEIDDVWLITKRRPQDNPPALEAERWFDENWQLVEETSFYRLAVRQYSR